MNEQEVRKILEVLLNDAMSDEGTDREIIDKALASLKSLEPKVEDINKFLLDWGKENSSFQKNEGFRNKLATAIVEYLKRGRK